MAVIAMFTGRGLTKAMYEALRREVKWETDLATGGLVHVCGFDDAGDLHVTDVWESEVAMNNFLGARLMPALSKLGIPTPTVSLIELHSLNLHPGSKGYMLG